MASVRDKFAFKGMMAPTFTALHDDGTLNLDVVRLYAQFLNDSGVTGAFVNGTLGEGLSLTVGERKQTAEAWVRCRDMVGHVVVQVGGYSLADTQDMARHAVAIGATAIATLPPLYDKPTTVAALLDYCRDVAAAAPDTPLLYYHYPAKSGVDLPMDEFIAAAVTEAPTLAGVKFTSLDIAGAGQRCLTAAQPAGITILSGFDESLSTARKLGFPGAINGSFNFVPLVAGRLFCLSGLKDSDNRYCCVKPEDRATEVARLQCRLMAPWDVIHKHSGGSTVSAAKHVMKLLTGIPVGPARKPQQPLSLEAKKCIEEELRELHFVVHDV